MSEGYNGYKNYPTYNISVWMNNREGDYTEFTERAKELLEEKEFDKKEAALELSGELEKHWEEQLIDTGHDEGPLFDFMQDALNQVDWIEVADGFLDDLDVYVVCWNQPGCLPEMEAMKFDNFDDARDAIVEQLHASEDDELEGDMRPTHLEMAISTAENATEPFTVEFGGYVYEVAKDE